MGPGFELYEDDDSGVNEKVSKFLRGLLPSVFPGIFYEKEAEMEWVSFQIWDAASSSLIWFSSRVLWDSRRRMIHLYVDRANRIFNKLTFAKVGPVPPSEVDNYKGQYIAAGYSGHGMPRAFSWYVDSLIQDAMLTTLHSAEAVAQMVIADMYKEEWSMPDWLPKRYVTSSAVVSS